MTTSPYRPAPVAFLALLAACSGGPPPTTTTPSPNAVETAAPSASAPAESSSNATPAPTAPAGAATTAPTAEPPPAPKVAEVAVRPFERLLEGHATSLALGKRGYAAVLLQHPWRFDGKKWKEEPLPAKLRGPAGAVDDVHVFFGRDNRMRLMGRRTPAEGEPGFVYLRYKHGWREGHREIGSLANRPHEPLFGILGWDDPEVVCKVGDICIIKRLTGWTIIKSGPGAPQVVIAQESAWALHADHIAEVSNDGWKKLPPIPFERPRGLWADTNEHLYVSAGESMHHFDGKAWQSFPSPVKAPKAVWGSAPNDVWVAGDDGGGHFDGKSWRKVKGLPGPLSWVLGRDGHVWFAGAAGTWRSNAAK